MSLAKISFLKLRWIDKICILRVGYDPGLSIDLVLVWSLSIGLGFFSYSLGLVSIGPHHGILALAQVFGLVKDPILIKFKSMSGFCQGFDIWIDCSLFNIQI